MTTQPNDDQSLKLFLAVRLEEKMFCYGEGIFFWRRSDGQQTRPNPVKDTEWLWVVAMVEATLNEETFDKYERILDEIISPTGFVGRLTSASWQDRTRALRKVLEP